MADPIIRILVEEASPGGGPPAKPGEAPRPGGGTPPAPTPKGEDDPGAQVAKTLRALFGRLVPGGQKALDLLGLGDTIDDVAKKAAPAIKRLSDSLSDFVKDLLGLGEKKAAPRPPEEGGKEKQSPARDVARRLIKDREGEEAPRPSKKLPRESAIDPARDPSEKHQLPRDAGREVADEIVPKGGGGEAGGLADEIVPKGGAAGGASGAFGSLEAAAVTLGPVLIAMEAVGKAGDMAAAGIRRLGGVAVEVVQNNPLAVMRRVADGIIETVDQVPVLGKAITAQVKPFLALADAAAALRDAFLGSAQKLSQYSGALSGAEALADVRHILADIDEAQRTGGKLSQVVTLQSEIEVEFQKAMVPLKEDLLEVLVPMMEFARNLASNFHYVVEFLRGMAKADEMILDILSPAYSLFKLLAGWIKDFLHIKDDADDDWNKLLDQWMNIDPGAESGVEPAPAGGFGGAPG